MLGLGGAGGAGTIVLDRQARALQGQAMQGAGRRALQAEEAASVCDSARWPVWPKQHH